MIVGKVALTLCFIISPIFGQFSGSTPVGEAAPAPLHLSLDDAIARGLKTNLGLLTRENSSTNARVDKMRLLTALLPSVTGKLSMSDQQLDLATFGFT